MVDEAQTVRRMTATEILQAQQRRHEMPPASGSGLHGFRLWGLQTMVRVYRRRLHGRRVLGGKN